MYTPLRSKETRWTFLHMFNIHTMYSLNMTNSLTLLGDFNSVMGNDLDIVTGEKHDGIEMAVLNKL